MTIYVVKCTFFRHFFWTFNFDGLSFLGQLRQERVIYLKRKPYKVPFESNTETGRISVMKGSRRVLVKVVLFQLRGHGQPQNDATANFFANSERPILGLSNEVSFVSELYYKDVQINKSVFIQNPLPKQKWQPLYSSEKYLFYFIQRQRNISICRQL